jgi:hypothetical protein
MHLIVMFVFVPVLVVMFFAVTVMLPANLVIEGLANGMPGAVVAGILLFLVIWSGIFAVFAH